MSTTTAMRTTTTRTTTITFRSDSAKYPRGSQSRFSPKSVRINEGTDNRPRKGQMIASIREGGRFLHGWVRTYPVYMPSSEAGRTVHYNKSCTVLIMNSKERHEARYQRRKAKRYRIQPKYEDVINIDALAKAARLSKKSINWKKSVQKYFVNLLRNLYETNKSLEQGENVAMGFIEFNICDRGKQRHIRAVHFKERVVQRSLCDNALIPAIQPSLIYDNGASQSGKGISFAVGRMKKHLHDYYRQNGNSNEGYILLVDYKSYFDTAKHQPLFDLIEKRFEDKRIVKLCHDFIDPFGEESLGIGSQISQIMAVAYPNRIDHMAKQDFRIKQYGRYMDDSYAIHRDKEYLQKFLEAERAECERLGITISNKKTMVVKLSKGFTFMKLRFILTDTGRVIVKPCHKSVGRMRRKLRRFKKNDMPVEDVLTSFNSWRGHVKRYNSYHAVRNMDYLFHYLYGGIQINKEERKKYDKHLCQ